jgi:predicted phage terminase large subunit-like protein
MPAPGTGGVQTSLTGMVQGMMASARAAFRRKPGPTPGAPIQSPGGNPPDLTQFSETFEPSGGLFAPGYPTGEDADETGIVVAGKDADGHGYVLADQSARYAPTEWARTAIALYRQHKADRIVAEVNNGGDMVEATIRMVDPNVSYNKVHASRGKVIRAEPVAALYEQGRIHHVGAFPTLEDQQCAFTTDFDRKAAGFSPDRVDALVWAMSDLLVEPMPNEGHFEYMRQRAAALKKPPPEPPKPVYAPGSLEYERQQAEKGE